MILLLSAGGGNQEGAFGPFLDFSRDGRRRFAARRGADCGYSKGKSNAVSPILP